MPNLEQRMGASIRDFSINGTMCNRCKHIATPGIACAAFPAGIPGSVLRGAVAHVAPIPGDQGLQFEPRKAE